MNLPSLKRKFFCAIQLYFLLSYLVAFGADEISRTYDYKGFDTNGNLLVQGVITLRVDETNKVKGGWELQVRDKRRLKELGQQDGTGKIGGRLNGDSIVLNLNPDVFGDNVYLHGNVNKGNIFKIKGKWGHYGYFEGKIFEGNFEMVRKEAPPPKKHSSTDHRPQN